MVVVHLQNDEPQQLPPTILNLFPVQEQEQNQQVFALITDFFDWLETAWQFPILTPDMVRKPLSLPAEFTEEAYTIPDLVHICGYSSKYLAHFCREHDTRPLKCGKEGHSATYRKQDLTPLLEQWNWKRLTQEVDHWWLRFFAPACGICQHCQRVERFPVTRQIYCARNSLLADLRLAFTALPKNSLNSWNFWANGDSA